jgi:hypothetical protein
MCRARLVLAIVAVAVLGCGGRTVGSGEETGSGASEASSSDSQGESESESDESEDESESSETGEPDLPGDPPAPCENGVNVLGECSTDTSGYTCYDTPFPDIGVPMCEGLTSGPMQLGLSSALAACGCESTRRLLLRDLDGDGADEILASCTIPYAVFVWRGRQDGALSCAEVFPVEYPGAMWFVDFDEDGLEDLITVWEWDVRMSLLRATSPGVFDVAQPLDAGVPGYLATALAFDVDSDGRPELLGSTVDGLNDYGPVITWAAEGGELSVTLDRFGDLTATNLFRAEIDGDGWPDLVAAAEQSWWARGSAQGLLAIESFDDGADYYSIGLGDIDGDQPAYRLGIGDGSFGGLVLPDAPAPQYNGIGGAPELLHDLDGDGRVELVFWGSEHWNVWRSSPTGPRFDMQVGLESTPFYAAGDVDGDGRGDLVTATNLMGSTNSQITRWRAQ